MSGKSKLTYKEALICEQQAAAKAQQLPKELMAPVLRMIQHSWVNVLSDLFIISDVIVVLDSNACHTVGLYPS